MDTDVNPRTIPQAQNSKLYNPALVAIIIIIIIILCFINSDTFKINLVGISSIQRGIVMPNKFWWGMTDILVHDKTAVELFYNIKRTQTEFFTKNSMLVPIKLLTLFGPSTVLVLDIDIAKYMLDRSPHEFTAGTYKNNLFRPLMTYNLGLLSGEKWKRLRVVNEAVLDTGRPHRYNHIFSDIIKKAIGRNLPTNFTEFSGLAKYIASMIIFGTYCPHQRHIYNTLTQSNRIPKGSFKIPAHDESQNYINRMMLESNKNDKTLISLLAQHQDPSLSQLFNGGDNKGNILADQIYHFVFPMLVVCNAIPKILALLIAHPGARKKLLSYSSSSRTVVIDEQYLINCVWETFRLNSSITSYLRKCVSSELGYPAGTDFLILIAPFLRDPIIFPNPDLFIPDRWTEELKQSKYNLIFGVGRQICPGRELSLSLFQSYLIHYINILQERYPHDIDVLGSVKLVNENILYINKREKPRISYAINPFKLGLILP